MSSESARTSWRRLAAGAGLGAAFAAISALRGGLPGELPLPANAIARVNDRLLMRDELDRALSFVAGDRREPPADADRAHVLDRLIDEELLVQHALASGLLEPGVADGRAARDVVVRTMIENATAEAAGREPTEEDLRTLLEDTAIPETGVSTERARSTTLDELRAERAREAWPGRLLDELRSRARIERFEGSTP